MEASDAALGSASCDDYQVGVEHFVAELASNCERAALAKAPPTRVNLREARNRFVKKDEIPVAAAVLAKLPDDGLTMDVVVNDMGGIGTAAQ